MNFSQATGPFGSSPAFTSFGFQSQDPVNPVPTVLHPAASTGPQAAPSFQPFGQVPNQNSYENEEYEAVKSFLFASRESFLKLIHPLQLTLSADRDQTVSIPNTPNGSARIWTHKKGSVRVCCYPRSLHRQFARAIIERETASVSGGLISLSIRTGISKKKEEVSLEHWHNTNLEQKLQRARIPHRSSVNNSNYQQSHIDQLLLQIQNQQNQLQVQNQQIQSLLQSVSEIYLELTNLRAKK